MGLSCFQVSVRAGDPGFSQLAAHGLWVAQYADLGHSRTGMF